MLLFLSMMRWTNPSQPTSSKLKVESKICFFEFCQFQSGIGPPRQSRLLQKMSGKKSTNRVRRLSVQENWYNWDHFQCRATREEGSGWEQAGGVTIKISNIQNLVNRPEQWIVTIPSSDQWLATIGNHWKTIANNGFGDQKPLKNHC